MNYWLIVENQKNWRADSEKSFSSYGFSERVRGTVEKINVGDLLISYVTKVSAFADIREVISAKPTVVEHMNEYESSDGAQGFTLRVETRPVVVLDRESWVPVKQMLDELVLTKGKKSWSWMFRTSIRKLEAADGKRIQKLIAVAAKNHHRGSAQ